jgi:hypothetical protein
MRQQGGVARARSRPDATSGAAPAEPDGAAFAGARYPARSFAIDPSSGRTQAGTPIRTYTARARSATAIADARVVAAGARLRPSASSWRCAAASDAGGCSAEIIDVNRRSRAPALDKPR